MKFKLEFQMDNAAFGDDDKEMLARELYSVIVRTANAAVEQIHADDFVGGVVRDTNGNTIGRWDVED